MSLHTYIPNSVLSSSDHNADHQGLADGTNDTDSNSLQKTRDEAMFDFVSSGLTIPTSANLISSVAAGIAYINGKRIAFSAVAKTFTASKDTYVDLKDDGTLVYVEVANGATSGMALTANAIRIAKVVTSGVAITKVIQGAGIFPGAGDQQEFAGLDPLGNPIYNTDPTDPFSKVGIWMVDASPMPTSFTVITSSKLTLNVPYKHKLEITMSGMLQINSNDTAFVRWKIDGTTVNAGQVYAVNTTGSQFQFPASRTLPGQELAAGSHYVELESKANNAGNCAANSWLYTIKVKRTA